PKGDHLVATAMADDGERGLWIGTRTGLYHLNLDQSVASAVDQEAEACIGHTGVGALAVAADGALWVGTEARMGRRAPGAQHFTALRTDDPRAAGNNPGVHALLFDPKGRLWVGTGTGLQRWTPQAGQWSVERLGPQGAAPSDVWSIVRDAAGQIWTGSITGGL